MDSFLKGTMLGDANVALSKSGKKAKFRISHTKKHEELVMAKFDILKRYVNTPPKTKINSGWGDAMVGFQTLAFPEFLKYYHMTWKNGKRILPLKVIKEITIETLAWWMMDDGSGDKNGLTISTYRYPKEQVVTATKIFNSLGLNCRKPTPNGEGIGFTTETSRFLALKMEKYFVPVMKYKIHDLLKTRTKKYTCIACETTFTLSIGSKRRKYCSSDFCQRVKALHLANNWSLEKCKNLLKNRRCLECNQQIAINKPATSKYCSGKCRRLYQYKLRKLSMTLK